jgi:putative cardiolipin synthase
MVLALAILLLRTPALHAETLRYLPSGELALSQLYTELTKAQHEIEIAQYYFEPCQTVGKIVLENLVSRSPGRKARILLDGRANDPSTRRALTTYLARHGVELRYFNATPENSRDGPTSNYRTHSKVLLADGSHAVIGGRNLCDDYFGLAKTWNWIDRDVWVEGESVRAAQESFDRLWNHKLTTIEAPASEAELAALEKCLRPNDKDRRVEAYLAKYAAENVADAPTNQCGKVEVSVDDMSHVKGAGGTIKNVFLETAGWDADGARKASTTKLLGVLKGANHSIVMENYSYAPSHELDELIGEKRRNQLSLDVFTNSRLEEILQTEHAEKMLLDDHGTEKIHAMYTSGGLGQHWSETPFTARYALHGKTFVVDGKDSVVSSFNLDRRSYHTNGEAVVAVRDCPEFAARMTQETDKLRNIWADDMANAVACFDAPEKQVGMLHRLIRNWIRELL